MVVLWCQLQATSGTHRRAPAHTPLPRSVSPGALIHLNPGGLNAELLPLRSARHLPKWRRAALPWRGDEVVPGMFWLDLPARADHVAGEVVEVVTPGGSVEIAPQNCSRGRSLWLGSCVS